MRKEKTKDAIEIIHRLYYADHPERLASLEEERENARIARTIYDLREKAGLTQTELAKLVGTSVSVIRRLEDADYQGPSLTMLQKIAFALNRRIEVRFLPAKAVTR